MATRLGDHRFDDKLDDLSPEARAANVERDRKALAELPRKVDYNTLSRGGQIDYEILRQHLTRAVWLAETFRPFEDDPRIYGDYLTESVYLLLTQSSLPRATNVQQRPGPHGRGPPGGRDRPEDDRPAAPGQGRDGDPPDQGGDRLLQGRPLHPGRRTSRGGGAGRAGRTGDPGAGGLPRLPRGRGLAPVDRVVADRPGEVRQEARPRARRRVSADGGVARGGSRGEPRRARDGRDRPADVGDDLPRRADPPRRRRRAGAP